MLENISRRQFLCVAAGIGAAAALGKADTILGRRVLPSEDSVPPAIKHRKLIVILFGGGTRSSESIDDPAHRYIPHLWNEMIPRGTLFTSMRGSTR